MIKIAHRGNISGPNEELENNPDYLYKAILAGYDVEADFWLIKGKFYFGHDEPIYPVDIYDIHQNVKKIWLHCKNLEALDFTLSIPNYYRSFWHQEDDFTITTNGYIWTYPGKPITNKSILVVKDVPSKDMLSLDMAGICSPYIGEL
jgi:hypothetical protein